MILFCFSRCRIMLRKTRQYIHSRIRETVRIVIIAPASISVTWLDLTWEFTVVNFYELNKGTEARSRNYTIWTI